MCFSKYTSLQVNPLESIGSSGIPPRRVNSPSDKSIEKSTFKLFANKNICRMMNNTFGAINMINQHPILKYISSINNIISPLESLISFNTFFSA